MVGWHNGTAIVGIDDGTGTGTGSQSPSPPGVSPGAGGQGAPGPSLKPTFVCRPGHCGPLCNVCVDGYFLKNGLCTRCDAEEVAWDTIVILAGIIGAFVFVAVAFSCIRARSKGMLHVLRARRKTLEMDRRALHDKLRDILQDVRSRGGELVADDGSDAAAAGDPNGTGGQGLGLSRTSTGTNRSRGRRKTSTHQLMVVHSQKMKLKLRVTMLKTAHHIVGLSKEGVVVSETARIVINFAQVGYHMNSALSQLNCIHWPPLMERLLGYFAIFAADPVTELKV